MPSVITMRKIAQAGQNLDISASDLGNGIRVNRNGLGLVIQENGIDVFQMAEVSTNGTRLTVDRPKNENGQDRRGWGHLGMLVALYYGRFKGCTTVKTGTHIEATAYAYWSSFDIGETDVPLSKALVSGRQWVLAKCPQGDPKLETFVVRDRLAMIQQPKRRRMSG